MTNEKGFYIVFHGDESVGWYSSEYKLEGDFNFGSIEEFNKFKNLLKVLFKHIDDHPLVESFSERATFLEDEKSLWSNIRDTERFYDTT